MQGSVEALTDALEKLSGAQVKVRVIHKGVGTINEGDILLAAASNAVVIGFNVRPEPKVAAIAAHEQVDMRFYGIIYQVTEDIKKAMTGLLAPTFKEEIQGRAEVRELFQVPKIGTVAGCGVLDGKITRSSEVRVIRDGIVVYTGKIELAAPLQGRRARGRRRLRVRHRRRELQRPEAGRHHRGLHPGPGRGDPLLGRAGGGRGDDRRHLLDRLRLAENHDLKGKRRVLKSVKDRVRNRFNVSIAEVDDLDAWQRSTLGVACVSKDRDQVESTLAHVATFIEELHLASVESVHTEIL